MKTFANVLIPMALAVASASCGPIEEAATQQKKAVDADATQPSAPTDPVRTPAQATIHASVSLGEDHVVQFVEYPAGQVGLIEIGRAMLDVPMVTPEVERLSWRDQYRYFAGASASLPKQMESALARVSLAPQEGTAKAPAALPTTGSGPHFYTAGEQTWFNQNFCNGAAICIQGFDWTNMQTPRKVGSASVFGMIGSEGQTNGTIENLYWACGGVWPFPTLCYWFENGTTVIVPGHFVHQTVSGNGSWYFKWELRGGGANTLVSSSATF